MGALGSSGSLQGGFSSGGLGGGVVPHSQPYPHVTSLGLNSMVSFFIIFFFFILISLVLSSQDTESAQLHILKKKLI